MCESHACHLPATWSVLIVQAARRPASFKFMCQWHRDQYFSPSPIPGIDHPVRASEQWRPSIVDMVRLADIEIRREEQARKARRG